MKTFQGTREGNSTETKAERQFLAGHGGACLRLQHSAAETEGSPTIQGRLGYVASWRPVRVTQTDAACPTPQNK